GSGFQCFIAWKRFRCTGDEFLFFFQAEDGIRDFHVTGVQTCALPISWRFTALSLAMNRHARDVLRRELPARQRTVLRVAGFAVLGLSLWLAAAATGWSLGLIEWVGMLSVSAVALALALTYAPRLAPLMAVGLPALATLTVLFAS